jgi:hypothetical protein
MCLHPLVSIDFRALTLRQGQNIFGYSIGAKKRSAGLDSSVSLPRKQGRGSHFEYADGQAAAPCT